MPTLTIILGSAGGTTSPPPGDHMYANNALVPVTALPDSGYVWDHWTSNLFFTQANPASFYITEDSTITAFFAPSGGYATVTVSKVGEGTTDPPVGSYPSTYAVGSTLYVTATTAPASGWQYKQMNRNGTPWTTANPGEFLNLQATENIEVVFERLPGHPPPLLLPVLLLVGAVGGIYLLSKMKW